MDTNQDVDSTIQDVEKPNEVVSSSEALPCYRILAGSGILPKHSEMPIEAFVALKITNEHVLRKWKEQIHFLQQKNQQLISEIQQLKGGKATLVTCAQGYGETSNGKETSHQETSHQERNRFKDEDMYGPNATANSDLVPYNLLRLHLKLHKLQQFPYEYRSVMKNVPGVSVQSRNGTYCTENGSMPSSSKRHMTETILTSTASNQNASFTGMHAIRMPPQDLLHQVHKEELYNQESPTHDEIMKEIQSPTVTTGCPLPKEVTTSSSSHTFPRSEGATSHTKCKEFEPSISCSKLCDNQVPTSASTEKNQISSTQYMYSESRNDIKILPVQSSLAVTNHENPFVSEHESKNDQLITGQNATLMACPVCSQTFPDGTKEEIVACHVHLHFDETLHQNDSFEILNE